jgi:Type II CAAX prenyl endopeptidase Rce1-like
MKEIFVYLGGYIRETNRKVWICTSLVVTLLIVLNYSVGIESSIKNYQPLSSRLLGFFLLYTFIFATSYGIQFLVADRRVLYEKKFFVLLLLCPLLFAIKISFDLSYLITNEASANPWSKFWPLVLNWPIKCILILSMIYSIWKLSHYKKPIAGMTKNFNWKAYLLLLACSVPLLVVASSMVDFQNSYPKVKNIAFIYPYTQYDFACNLFFELSYGVDFFTIEAFFRGFVVLAFVRYVGRDAILPMAAFYCTIHFGKPLFECITSYLGGILLGAIVYNTRSIWGGLIIHLGMAWLMELSTLINAN